MGTGKKLDFLNSPIYDYYNQEYENVNKKYLKIFLFFLKQKNKKINIQTKFGKLPGGGFNLEDRVNKKYSC